MSVVVCMSMHAPEHFQDFPRCFSEGCFCFPGQREAEAFASWHNFRCSPGMLFMSGGGWGLCLNPTQPPSKKETTRGYFRVLRDMEAEGFALLDLPTQLKEIVT